MSTDATTAAADTTTAAATTTAATTAAAAGPWYGSLIGSDGKLNHTAFDSAPDAIKPYVGQFKRYESLDALLNGFGNAATLASKKALLPLPADATPEMRAEQAAHLRSINQVPEKPDGYGIKRPDYIPEQVWDNDVVSKSQDVFHKHSASPAMVKELMEIQYASTKDQLARVEQQQAAWFAEQETQISTAAQAKNITRQKAQDMAERGAGLLGINPKESASFRTLEGFNACLRAAELIAEHKIVTGDAPEGVAGDSLAQARDIMGNPQNPLYKAHNEPTHPQHEAAKARVSALYQAHFGARK